MFDSLSRFSSFHLYQIAFSDLSSFTSTLNDIDSNIVGAQNCPSFQNGVSNIIEYIEWGKHPFPFPSKISPSLYLAFKMTDP